MRTKIYLNDWFYNCGIIGFLKILEHDEIKYDKKYIDLYQQLTKNQVQYNHIQSKKVRKTLIIAIIYFGIIIFIFNQALSSTSQTYNSMQEYVNEQYDDLDHVETILEFNQNGWHIGLFYLFMKKMAKLLIVIQIVKQY